MWAIKNLQDIEVQNIQITGEETYRKVGDAIGVDLIKNPHLLSTNDAVSKAAVKAYLKIKGFSNYSKPEDMIKSINLW